LASSSEKGVGRTSFFHYPAGEETPPIVETEPLIFTSFAYTTTCPEAFMVVPPLIFCPDTISSTALSAALRFFFFLLLREGLPAVCTIAP
jgi:hypothetical protein